MASRFDKLLDDLNRNSGSNTSPTKSSNTSTTKSSSGGSRFEDLLVQVKQEEMAAKKAERRQYYTTKKEKKPEKESWLDNWLIQAAGLGVESQSGTPFTSTQQKRMDEVADKAQKKKQDDGRTWFQKGALEDGVNSESIAKTILGTGTDIGENLLTGIIGLGEKTVDALAYLAPYAYQSQYIQASGGFTSPEQQKMVEDVVGQSKEDIAPFIAKDLYNEEEVSKKILSELGSAVYLSNVAQTSGQVTQKDFDTAEQIRGESKKLVEKADTYSVLGEKSDAVIQSAGQLAAQVGLQAVGVPWFVTSGVSAFGGEAENALNQGATYEAAGASGLISAGAEILTEKISGGIKFGGKALDDVLTQQIARGISDKTLRTLAKLGLDMTGEGAEEVLSQVLSTLGSSLYKEENLAELLFSEEAFDEYLEAFIGGMALGGSSNAINAIRSNSQGVDYASGLTETEQKVVDMVYKSRLAEAEKNGKVSATEKTKFYDSVVKAMDRGEISIETIEEALGGDSFTAYNELSKEAEEYETLYDTASEKLSQKQRDRLAELIKKNEANPYESAMLTAKENLSQSVFSLAENSRLAESYTERSNRGKAFEADLSKYDTKYHGTIQKAIDSGILNNTRRTHEFVDMIAKISADKGVPFDFANNAKLKESGFALDGRVVNGLVTKDGITLNIDSAKALNTTVGHEITHVLEGTELYGELQKVLFEYATNKGELDSRRSALAELYKDLDADIDAELTADLIGDYLFTDTDFINRLSTEHRNGFQKIYDEVKYLCKVATAGSKEARQLEAVKKAFAEAYRADSKALSETKYSLESVDGIGYVQAEKNIFTKEDGTAASERDIFNSLVGKTISLPDGDIKIVKNLPGKRMYEELYKRQPHWYKDVENVKQLNSDVNYNMEELLGNSDAKRLNAPDEGNRHAEQGVVSFDTRVVKFYDGNKAYDIEFSIANLQNGEKVAYAKKFFGYDAELTKKIQTSETRGLTNTPMNQQSVSKERVSQKEEPVKPKHSLSKQGETFKPNSNNVYGKDIALAPVKSEVTTDNAKVNPVKDNVTTLEDNPAPYIPETVRLQNEMDAIMQKAEAAEKAEDWETYSQLAAEYDKLYASQRELEADETQRLDSLSDADIPPEMEAPIYDDTPVTVDDPFENRDYKDVGNKSVKAYQYENPEVKPFFRLEAEVMLGELQNGEKGQRFYADVDYLNDSGYTSHGVWTGQKRMASDDIAYLLDNGKGNGTGYTYVEIEEGLNAIIEDNGKENNACSKRIEFILNDRLRDGYTAFGTNEQVPPNQDYINLLNEKQINEYSKESFDAFMQTADDYAPIAPVAETKPVADVAPVLEEVKAKDKGAIKGQKAMPGVKDETQTDSKKTTRQVLHSNIVDGIKAKFAEKGFDFDDVLRKAKNLSTFATVDNTPQRVMEKSLGYKAGQILSDITVNKVAQNESAGIKWLNSFTNRKDGVLAQISKQYNIKPGSKESAAAQMYAEGFYVNEKNEIIAYGDKELAKDFPNAKVQANIKGLAGDQRIRQIYDETLAMINESRARNAYPEIPRLDNYFLHFRAMEDTFSRLGLPFNPNDIRAKDLPTDLNGVTADLKPGQPFFASAMHRMGKRTSFDLLGGLERYLTSAKNQIYHIDDIQTLRALRNYIADTYGQAHGLEDIDTLSEEEAEERIKQVYGSHLSTFAKFLNEEANVLAGKTSLLDRGIEGIIGRRGITFLNEVRKQTGSNMVGYNISSSLTNFLPVAQTLAKTNKADFIKAVAQTASNKVSSVFGKSDGFVDNNPTIIRRNGADRFYRTPWQKMADPGYALMGAVDNISTELIVRTKYNEYIRKGMNAEKAVIEADKWASRLMADRSLGQQPLLYNSKMLGLITQFQIEVRNQLDSQFYDTIQEAKVSNEDIQNGLARNAKTAAKVTSTFVQLAVAQHLFGKAFESVAGYNPAFDIIDVLIKTFGFDDEEDSEDTALDNIEEGFMALLEDLPYTSILTDGGRIPISSALPVQQFIQGVDKYGNEKSRWETLGEIAPYYLMPGGYSQAKKSVQGLKMFDDDLPISGSYTDSGNLRFPVEDAPINKVQAGIFGQWASENARKYFNEEQRTLNPEQTAIFAGLDIPIEEYWEYRDKFNAFKDFKSQLMDAAFANGATDEDQIKGWYIDAVNDELYELYDKQIEIASGNSKNKKTELRKLQSQMENLISDSQKAVNNVYVKGYYAEIGNKRYDYSAYGGGWYEISGKYLKQEQAAVNRYGITPEEYWNDTDLYYQADWYFDDMYATVDREAVANLVFGGKKFAPYAAELAQIKGEDNDGDGKNDSGTKKTNVFAYIDSLNIEPVEKAIMRKMSYPSEDKDNRDIIKYLKERDDISRAEMKTILVGLGFEVDDNGRITW